MQERTEEIRAHYNADPAKEWNRLKKRHLMKNISPCI